MWCDIPSISNMYFISNCGNNLDLDQQVLSGKVALDAVAHSLALLVHPGVPDLCLQYYALLLSQTILLSSEKFRHKWKVPRSWQQNLSWYPSARSLLPRCCSCSSQHPPTASQSWNERELKIKRKKDILIFSNLDKGLLSLLDYIACSNVFNDPNLL